MNCSACGFIRGGVVVEPIARAGPIAAPGATSAADGVDPGRIQGGDDTAHAVVDERPRRRRLPLGAVAVLAIVVVSAVAGLVFNASRGSTGQIEKAGDLTASELRVGDCFDLKDPAAETVGDVTARPCNEEHEYETYAVASMPPGDFPAQATLEAFTSDTCVPAFEGYVGKAYADSDLEIFVLQPTADSWSNGDRSVQCAVYHPRIHRLTESLKGSNQ